MSASPRTALVTGSNGGVGLALAQRLATDGWRVLLHGRDTAKLHRAVQTLPVAAGVRHVPLAADLADLEAVYRLAHETAAATDRLDVLVHNAGLTRPRLERTPAGVEVTHAVNALAPFVLTNALREKLEASAQVHGSARVVTVSSEAHRGGRFPDLTAEAIAATMRGPADAARYSSVGTYAHSKLVATTWTLELARRLEGSGVTANACHPGVVRTGVFDGVSGALGVVARLASVLYLSPRRGSASPYLLATGPAYATRTGRWVTQSHVRRPHEATPPATAGSAAAGAAVWQALAALSEPSS